MKHKIIRNKVEEELNIDLENICRRREYVYARALYFGLCKELTKDSLDFIGSTLDKNHATVLHNINNIFNNFMIYGEKKYLKAYHKIKSECSQMKDNTWWINKKYYVEDLIRENVRMKRELEKQN
jgi:chromosomal replication initiation ATPase DnaA